MAPWALFAGPRSGPKCGPSLGAAAKNQHSVTEIWPSLWTSLWARKLGPEGQTNWAGRRKRSTACIECSAAFRRARPCGTAVPVLNLPRRTLCRLAHHFTHCNLCFLFFGSSADPSTLCALSNSFQTCVLLGVMCFVLFCCFTHSVSACSFNQRLAFLLPHHLLLPRPFVFAPESWPGI